MEYADFLLKLFAFIAGGVVTAVGSWYGMRDSVRSALHQSADAAKDAAAAHAAAKAAHARIDNHQDRLIGLEKEQSFHAKRLEDALTDIRDSIKEMRASIDRLGERGVHCGHCKGDGD